MLKSILGNFTMLIVYTCEINLNIFRYDPLYENWQNLDTKIIKIFEISNKSHVYKENTELNIKKSTMLFIQWHATMGSV